MRLIARSMQTKEEFMAEYFGARIPEEWEHPAMRELFRGAYFTENCGFDIYAEKLALLESETILSAEDEGEVATVVTEQVFAYRGAPKKIRLKYFLARQGESWRISEMARVRIEGIE